MNVVDTLHTVGPGGLGEGRIWVGCCPSTPSASALVFVDVTRGDQSEPGGPDTHEGMMSNLTLEQAEQLRDALSAILSAQKPQGYTEPQFSEFNAGESTVGTRTDASPLTERAMVLPREPGSPFDPELVELRARAVHTVVNGEGWHVFGDPLAELKFILTGDPEGELY